MKEIDWEIFQKFSLKFIRKILSYAEKKEKRKPKIIFKLRKKKQLPPPHQKTNKIALKNIIENKLNDKFLK